MGLWRGGEGENGACSLARWHLTESLIEAGGGNS